MAWVAGAVVGVVLIVAGAAKLTSKQWPVQADALGVPHGAARVVPILELTIGVALVAGVRFAGIAAVALLSAFTAFLIVALRRGVEAPCACFGRVLDATRHVVVGRAQRGADRVGGPQPGVTRPGPTGSVVRMNAITSASSRHESYRPDFPPWPATISVFSTSGRSPVPVARSRATHFAGSW